MLFDSPVYVVFLGAVTLFYWRLPFRAQNCFLLVASYFFYGWWDWRFVFLLAASSALDFYIARLIAAAQIARQRRIWLIASLLINFSVSGVLQVLQFLSSVRSARAADPWAQHLPRCSCRSFCRRGSRSTPFRKSPTSSTSTTGSWKPADSLVDYALFISLFPHLIAGPIQRPSHLLPQVQQPRIWRSDKASSTACMLISAGLFRSA